MPVISFSTHAINCLVYTLEFNFNICFLLVCECKTIPMNMHGEIEMIRCTIWTLLWSQLLMSWYITAIYFVHMILLQYESELEKTAMKHGHDDYVSCYIWLCYHTFYVFILYCSIILFQTLPPSSSFLVYLMIIELAAPPELESINITMNITFSVLTCVYCSYNSWQCNGHQINDE